MRAARAHAYFPFFKQMELLFRGVVVTVGTVGSM